jgi:hypothetical protein
MKYNGGQIHTSQFLTKFSCFEPPHATCGKKFVTTNFCTLHTGKFTAVLFNCNNNIIHHPYFVKWGQPTKYQFYRSKKMVVLHMTSALTGRISSTYIGYS